MTPGPLLFVMLITETQGFMFSPTPTAPSWTHQGMGAYMLAVRFVQSEIFDSVVVSHSINVMHDFVLGQAPAKVPRHYQAVFQDVPVATGHRMIAADLDPHITVGMASASASPCGAVTTRGGQPHEGHLTTQRTKRAGACAQLVRLSCNQRPTMRAWNQHGGLAHRGNYNSPVHTGEGVNGLLWPPHVMSCAEAFYREMT